MAGVTPADYVRDVAGRFRALGLETGTDANTER
jgi:hypothetical protein